MNGLPLDVVVYVVVPAQLVGYSMKQIMADYERETGLVLSFS